MSPDSSSTYYLDLADLLEGAVYAVGVPSPEVRDYGLLESALARPQATAFGEDAYHDLATKAAALLHSLAGNYPLVDGNKRLALLGMLLFLDLNDKRLDASDDELFELVMAVASGALVDVAEIAAVIKPWVVDPR